VHEFAGPDNGIDRTGVDALAASDASLFVNDCPRAAAVGPAVRVKRLRDNGEEPRQRLDGSPAAWRATVDIGGAGGDRFGIGTAIRIAAAGALRLRQTGIDFENPLTGEVSMHRCSIACAWGGGNGTTHRG